MQKNIFEKYRVFFFFLILLKLSRPVIYLKHSKSKFFFRMNVNTSIFQLFWSYEEKIALVILQHQIIYVFAFRDYVCMTLNETEKRIIKSNNLYWRVTNRINAVATEVNKEIDWFIFFLLFIKLFQTIRKLKK